MSTQTVDIADVINLDAPGNLHPADACAIVIFGASGDLARRKLIPALFELASTQCLAHCFAIVGFARTKMSDDAFRDSVVQALHSYDHAEQIDQDKLRIFLQNFSYVSGDYSDPDAFQALERHLGEVDRRHNLAGNRLFYLATPPEVYPRIVEEL